MYDVLTIGTATRDVFLQSHLFRPVADPHFASTKEFPTGEAECFAFGGKIEIPAPTFTVGGGAVNSAVTFARQELSVAAMCAVGKDEAGKEIIKSLNHENIKTIISYMKDVGTSYSTLLLSDVGERTILVYRGASDYLGRSRKLEARAVYVAPGAIPRQPLLRLLRKYKSAGSMIVMNPSGYYITLGTKMMQKFLELLDVLMLNREEAASLTGMSYQEEKNIFSQLDKMFNGIVVVTDGVKGSTVLYRGKMFRAGIFHNEKVVDRTGAGDAYGSAFTAALLQKSKIKNQKEKLLLDIIEEEDIKHAMRFASANATSVVETIGATPGILTKAQFDEGERWKNFDVQVKSLSH